MSFLTPGLFKAINTPLKIGIEFKVTDDVPFVELEMIKNLYYLKTIRLSSIQNTFYHINAVLKSRAVKMFQDPPNFIIDAFMDILGLEEGIGKSFVKNAISKVLIQDYDVSQNHITMTILRSGSWKHMEKSLYYDDYMLNPVFSSIYKEANTLLDLSRTIIMLKTAKKVKYNNEDDNTVLSSINGVTDN